MKKILLLFILILSFSFLINVYAEDNIKEYTFEEFYGFCNDIAVQAQEIREVIPWKEKFGCELGSDELSTLEQTVFYNDFTDRLYNLIVYNKNINRNDTIRVRGCISDVSILDSDLDYVKYESDRNGQYRIVITEHYIEDYGYDDKYIFIRSTENMTKNIGEYVTIEGKFLKSSCVNDMDYLYDCSSVY